MKNLLIFLCILALAWYLFNQYQTNEQKVNELKCELLTQENEELYTDYFAFDDIMYTKTILFSNFYSKKLDTCILITNTETRVWQKVEYSYFVYDIINFKRLKSDLAYDDLNNYLTTLKWQ